jgi:predicted phage gp36 major capsid-like protein
MTQLTQEEIRDELLSLFEEHEEDLSSYTSQIEKIENESIELFERKIIAIKNRLVADSNITDEELQKKYLEEVEEARKTTLKDVEEEIKLIISKTII